MGEHSIRRPADEREARAFSSAVVRDIRALDALIERGGIETGITRMGVEQEMYLVGPGGLAAPCAERVLERIEDPRFTTELARFNLEANFDPQVLQGGFLATLEAQLGEALGIVDTAAAPEGARVLLTGILPTLRGEDVSLANLTPILRYEYLNEALFRGRESATVFIEGIEEYRGVHDSVMLEGANTSLQLHLQVTPATGATLYNVMQLITAPLLAAATNSPVLLGKRLWHETRIAVFERSLDARTGAQLVRGHPTRVCFGEDWVHESLVELFRDNAARFPAILTRELEEDSAATVAAGGVPRLAALALHNGTVWRWNRPCFGVAGGVAHLRIENRVLPSGPSVLDEVANAALFYGLMQAVPEDCAELTRRIAFGDVRRNFVDAARYGLGAELAWLDGRRVGARALLLEELLPAARRGLAALAVPDSDIDRYLGVVEARVTSGQTGSNWLLASLRARHDENGDGACASLLAGAVAAMLAGQRSGQAVHEWPLAQAQPTATADDATGPAAAVLATVGSLMTRDLFTLRPDDVVDLASGVMEWKRIRHIPVEDADGVLVGIVTARDLLRSPLAGGEGPAPVRDIMRTEFPCVGPELSLAEAVPAVLASDLGALLVVSQGRLVGIVTERDLLRAAARHLPAPAAGGQFTKSG